MDRRRWLLVAATGFAGLAGCAGTRSGSDENVTEGRGNRSGGDRTRPTESTRAGGPQRNRTGATETTRSDGGGRETGSSTSVGAAKASFGLASSAFDAGGRVPRRFTCAGANVSPPLAVDGVPASAAALALVVDDPDAGAQPFTHWLVWNLPPETAKLPANVPHDRTLSTLGGARQGTNDGGGVGYTGPCPPTGEDPHTYRFRLSALDSPLDVDPGAERAAVTDAIDGTETRRTLLRGTFERE